MIKIITIIGVTLILITIWILPLVIFIRSGGTNLLVFVIFIDFILTIIAFLLLML